jgi:integrase
LNPVTKDTKTRYQGVYARHKQDCALAHGGDCDCSPSYWGKAWDRSSGKHRKTRMFPSLAAARQARSDLEATLLRGSLPASGTMRVAAAIEAYLRAIESGTALNKHGRQYKPSAIRDLKGALKNHVKDELGAKRIADVRRGDVQRLVDQLTPAKSGSSVRTVVNAIRSLYAWAQDRELVSNDPAQRVRLPAMDATPRDRIATVGETQRLLTPLDAKDALPYAIAVYTGARRSEIRHLLVGDVDLELGVIYLGADERGRKSRAAQRAVPLVKSVSALIRRRLLERGRPGASELLCPGEKPGGRNTGMLSFEALQARADDRWEKAKLQRITAHECRHTFVSWLDAATVRPSVISRLAGHAMRGDGAQVTARYTHELPGDLERAREHLEAYLATENAKEATG